MRVETKERVNSFRRSIVASKNIKKGTKIIDYVGKIITNKQVDESNKFDNKKPIYLSTGMSNMLEVNAAVEIISKNSKSELVVFQCTTNYPSDISEANINVIDSYKSIPNIKVGYSDHVVNNFACFAAVAKGVHAIEKHFTIDKSLPGPDHSCSLNPKQFQDLVYGIRQIEKSLGLFKKLPTKKETENMFGMKRSLVYAKSIKKGTVLNLKHFAFKRPMNGLTPNEVKFFIGK